jgi:hypothetical protein
MAKKLECALFIMICGALKMYPELSAAVEVCQKKCPWKIAFDGICIPLTSPFEVHVNHNENTRASLERLQ